MVLLIIFEVIVMSNNKDIEIVVNNDSELDISPVYEHLHAAKPKPKENKKNIIIPEVKENK